MLPSSDQSSERILVLASYSPTLQVGFFFRFCAVCLCRCLLLLALVAVEQTRDVYVLHIYLYRVSLKPFAHLYRYILRGTVRLHIFNTALPVLHANVLASTRVIFLLIEIQEYSTIKGYRVML